MNPMVAVWLMFAALLLTLIFVIVFIIDTSFELNLDKIYTLLMGLIFILMLTALMSIIFFHGVEVVE